MVIYDIEIEKAIPPRDGLYLEGIEYCKGWRDYENMGVAVIGAYDYSTTRYRVFCRDNMIEWLELSDSTDLLIGFNNKGFDDPVLQANGMLSEQNEVARYDLLSEIWQAAGLSPTWGGPTTHGGYGLDAVCEVNFDHGKTGHGALAPVDWQRGNIASVIDYCLADVWLTKQIFDRALIRQAIIDPKTGSDLILREPN